MPEISLIPHPTTACAAVQAMTVTWHDDDDVLTLHYTLEGDIAALHVPASRPAQHTDGLWQDTCFEAFLHEPEPSAGYYEFNFSPSGAWAVYHFDAYRQGMAMVTIEPPLLTVYHDATLLSLTAKIRSHRLPAVKRLALSAVIKDQQGRVYYWAAKHPSDKPDFHHPDSFIE